jgi:hypothetical protein
MSRPIVPACQRCPLDHAVLRTDSVAVNSNPRDELALGFAPRSRGAGATRSAIDRNKTVDGEQKIDQS